MFYSEYNRTITNTCLMLTPLYTSADNNNTQRTCRLKKSQNRLHLNSLCCFKDLTSSLDSYDFYPSISLYLFSPPLWLPIMISNNQLEI